jgi:REP element-mobilizing transposase RayT
MDHRKSIRLPGYDYSTIGAYFVTICSHEHQCLFGEVVNNEVILNDIGNSIRCWWSKLSEKYPTIETDVSIIMPNHFHGIIQIVGVDPCVDPTMGGHMDPPLHRMIQWFKTMTTNEYFRGEKQKGRLYKKLWQRNYYEHIIRNEQSLDTIREYIFNNSLKWDLDKYHPNNIGQTHVSTGRTHGSAPT